MRQSSPADFGAARQQFAQGTFDAGHRFAVDLLDSRHALANRVKGQFGQARPGLQSVAIDADFSGRRQDCRFGRIAQCRPATAGLAGRD
jgi:hypothetical protein